MAIVGIRATIKMQVDRYGIAEQHLYLPTAATLDPALLAATTLAKKRAKLLGYPGKLISVTVSREGVFRDAKSIGRVSLGGNDALDITYSGSGDTAITNHADQPKACLQLRAEGDDIRHGTIFLAGIPDVLITEGPEGPNLSKAPGWYTDYLVYKAELIGTATAPSQWGFIGRMQAAALGGARDVIAVFNNVNTGNLSVVTQVGGGTFAVNKVVQLRKFKRTHPAFASANGQWVVDNALPDTPVAGKQTYELRNSANVASATIEDFGTIELVDYEGIRYTDLEIVNQTTRKRGNRFLAGPGRRRVRRPLPG